MNDALISEKVRQALHEAEAESQRLVEKQPVPERWPSLCEAIQAGNSDFLRYYPEHIRPLPDALQRHVPDLSWDQDKTAFTYELQDLAERHSGDQDPMDGFTAELTERIEMALDARRAIDPDTPTMTPGA